MYRPRLLLTMAIALLSAVCYADEPSTKPTTAPAVSNELSVAMQQLADDEAAVRQAAQDRIVLMGKDAVPPLKALIESTSDVEQRTGAEAAVARIAELASTGPTLITMKMKNVSPKEVLNELVKQSGVSIKDTFGENGWGKNKKVSINFDRQPFWAAVKEICSVTGMSIQNRGQGDALYFVNGGNDMTGPTVIDGPFMVIAQSINMSSNIQLGQPGNSNKNESIQFLCFAEPKLQITQHPYSIRLTEAVDDTGKSLVASGQEGMYDGYNADPQPIWQSQANLVVPDAAAKKIVLLRGKMRLVAATKTEVIEIPDLLTARNITKSAGGQSLTVKNATANGDDITVNVTIMVPPNGGNIGYTMAQNIRLVDAAGNKLGNPGINGGGNMTKLEYQMTFNKRNNEDGESKFGTPVKLILPIATETKPIECNFEFKDLPLP